VDGDADAAREPTGKKRGRKPKSHATEGTSGETKAKRGKQAAQVAADKSETAEKSSRDIGYDGSDNATSV
jgi:hypothetical protein